MADADLPTDDEVLTQFVHAGEPPNCSPRPQDRDGLSLIRGRLGVTEAGHLVKFRSGAEEGDSVRYITAGALRARGFSVVSPGEVLHEYDVPLAGFLHAFGQTYLFANLLGDARPLGVWGYVEVDEYDVKELLSAYGPEAADAAVEAAFRNRSVTLALAHDHEIRQVANLESEDEGTLALTNRFLHQLQGRLKQDSEETQLLSQDPSLAIA